MFTLYMCAPLGLWSAGHRLLDGAVTGGEGLGSGEFPEFSCGGALRRARSRKAGRKRKRRDGTAGTGGRGFKGPNLHTGKQVETRKAGGRVSRALPGEYPIRTFMLPPGYFRNIDSDYLRYSQAKANASTAPSHNPMQQITNLIPTAHFARAQRPKLRANCVPRRRFGDSQSLQCPRRKSRCRKWKS